MITGQGEASRQDGINSPGQNAQRRRGRQNSHTRRGEQLLNKTANHETHEAFGAGRSHLPNLSSRRNLLRTTYSTYSSVLLKLQIFLGKEIEDPPKSARLGSILILLMIAICSLALFMSGRSSLAWVLVPVTIMLLPAAISSKSVYAIHITLYVAFWFLAGIFPQFHIAPLFLLIPLLFYAYTVAVVAPLRQSVGWLRVGRFDGTLWTIAFATIVGNGVAILLWMHKLNPDLARYTAMVPKASLGWALILALAFAAMNALLEEAVWRGIMMESLDSALGAGYWSMLIQALQFGLAHYWTGFPNGIVGCSTTFAFALVLGMMRRKSKGMLACWFVHAAADFMIVCLLMWYVPHSLPN